MSDNMSPKPENIDTGSASVDGADTVSTPVSSGTERSAAEIIAEDFNGVDFTFDLSNDVTLPEHGRRIIRLMQSRIADMNSRLSAETARADNAEAEIKTWALETSKHLDEEAALISRLESAERENRTYSDIKAERARQVEQWGGAAHDDRHDDSEWREYREKFEDRIAYYGLRLGEKDYPAVHRNALVKIAALAVAQIEALGRRYRYAPPSPEAGGNA